MRLLRERRSLAKNKHFNALMTIGDLRLVQFLILRDNNLWKEKETLIDKLNK